MAAGKHRVEVEDFDFSYGLYADGRRVICFAEGRIGYREWARRNRRLEDIHSLDDRLDHDVDELMAWVPGRYKRRFLLRGAHLHAMLGGTCLRRCAWFVGGMRAVLGQWAGGSLPLPQAKAPSTVARLVIHVGPESYCQGSGTFA